MFKTAFLVLSLPTAISGFIKLRLLLEVAIIFQPILEYITTKDTIGTRKKTIEENSYKNEGTLIIAQKAEEFTFLLENGSLKS